MSINPISANPSNIYPIPPTQNNSGNKPENAANLLTSLSEEIKKADKPTASAKDIVGKLKGQVQAELKGDQHIKEGKVYSALKALPPEQIKKVGDYLRNGFFMGNANIPANKISLASYKDALDKPCDYKPEHLLVLLSSVEPERVQSSAKEAKNRAVADTLKYYEAGENVSVPKEITRNYPEGSITLRLANAPGWAYQKSQDKIEKIFDLVSNANKLIPDDPVKEVEIDLSAPESKVFYDYPGRSINLKIGEHESNDEKYLNSLAHEMGHAISHRRILHNPPLYAKLDKIHKNSLKKNAYEIVDDSNYVSGQSDNYGHPNDDADELFASAFSAYFLNRNRLEGFMNDPDTSRKAKGLARDLIHFIENDMIKARPSSLSPQADIPRSSY